MTKIINSTALAATFAAAALAGLVLATGESQASATSAIFKCQTTNKAKTVSCCESVVERRGLPYWMINANLNCASAAVCSVSKQTSHPVTYYAANFKQPKHKCGYKIPGNNDGGTNFIPGGGKQPNGPITYNKP
jgi:hypothetical protein